MKYHCLSFQVEEGIALLGFGPPPDSATSFSNSPSLPVLNEQVLSELEEVLGEVKKKQGKEIKGLLFFTHHKKAFLAGADVKLIASLKTESQATQGAEWGQKIFNMIEDFSIPTLACVHGFCLGGGCELVLACDKVMISRDPSTALGLPEVKLGLIPGFGGTYRMPRRVGLSNALSLILTGKQVGWKKALKMGLVDGVFPVESLIPMGKKALLRGFSPPSSRERVEKLAKDNFILRKVVFSKARENVLKKTKGHYEAPLKILGVMESGQGQKRNSYLSMEATAFGELCMGVQSQNLQYVFSLMDGAKKYREARGGDSGNVQKVSQGAVLGAGNMGGGLAWLFAKNAQRPIVKDVSLQSLEQGLQQSSQNFRSELKRKKITPSQFERFQRSITPTLHYTNMASVDLLIEAVTENLELKKKVFQEVEKHLREDCLITSNTSSLRVTEMAQALVRPERFAGLHFFNPVHRMPLVEIVTHSKVAQETIESLYHWVLQVKKVPLVVRDGPGFLVNRILMPYMNIALDLLTKGVPHGDIESACLNFGMPMGPFRLLDEVGIDVGIKVLKEIHQALGDRMCSHSLIEDIVKAGFLGRKNDKGFYLYKEGRKKEWNQHINKFFPHKSTFMGEKLIQQRIFFPMVNEAAHILDEKIVISPKDVDLGVIFGIGFPPFRGGILRYADREGLDQIVQLMKEFSREAGPHYYTPAPYLERLVHEKRCFHSL